MSDSASRDWRFYAGNVLYACGKIRRERDLNLGQHRMTTRPPLPSPVLPPTPALPTPYCGSLACAGVPEFDPWSSWVLVADGST
jgi:hypothetical protein